GALGGSSVAASRNLSPGRIGRTKTGAVSPSRTVPWSWVAVLRTTLSPAPMERRDCSDPFIVFLQWLKSRRLATASASSGKTLNDTIKLRYRGDPLGASVSFGTKERSALYC